MASEPKPWTHGPAEIYRHAHGHMDGAADTDRRLALIGFDNAIEVAIDAFLGLHPRLRDGYTLSREATDAASRNYHAKIEFLETYLEATGKANDLDTNAIIWYHQLRNQLYHSGNGMTPEAKVLVGARDAARSVFKVLFGFDPSPTAPTPRQAIPRDPSPVTLEPDSKLLLLSLFQVFESRLAESVSAERGRGPMRMWDEFRIAKGVSPKANERVRFAIETRNRIAHGDAAVSAAEASIAGSYLTAVLDDISR